MGRFPAFRSSEKELEQAGRAFAFGDVVERQRHRPPTCAAPACVARHSQGSRNRVNRLRRAAVHGHGFGPRLVYRLARVSTVLAVADHVRCDDVHRLAVVAGTNHVLDCYG